MSDNELRADDFDPDFSHVLLIAVLMKLGGSIELGPGDMAPNVLGDHEGRAYRVALDPLDATGSRVRVSVVPTAEQEERNR